mmetsp:Transcript_87959/g.122041  ORF Transcript_87959/g.122041 Transcript_87959/m.122041 type:complete len:92 (+) Transcript_87959:95-370(+)
MRLCACALLAAALLRFAADQPDDVFAVSGRLALVSTDKLSHTGSRGLPGTGHQAHQDLDYLLAAPSNSRIVAGSMLSAHVAWGATQCRQDI